MRNGFFVLFLTLTLAAGQTPPMSPETRKEILSYQLTTQRADHLISVLPLMTQFFMSQPQPVLATWAKLTPAKNRKKTSERLEMSKFCRHCRKHTAHKESK